MITASIVAIAIFSTATIIVASLCRLYYKNARKKSRYEQLYT